MEKMFHSEDLGGWMAANLEVSAMVDAVRTARAEADAKISDAADSEGAFQESIVKALDAHAQARALNDAVQAKLAADEDPTFDDLVDRETAEKAARAAAFDVAAKSEVVADFLELAAEAARKRADAEAAYSRAVAVSEVVLDNVVDEILGDAQ